MSVVKVNFKKLVPEAVEPKYAKPGDDIFGILDRRTKKSLNKKSITQYKKRCGQCSLEFWVDKKKTVYCSRTCSNTAIRAIKDPIEHFFREKINRNRSNAKNRKIDFDITWSDLFEIYKIQNGKCFYTGRALGLTYSTKTRKVCPADQLSVDRIDPNKGYLKNNIVLCCYAINNLKGDMSAEEFDEYLIFLTKKDLKLKVKKLTPNAVIPKYARPGDVGLDLTAVSKSIDEYGNIVYGTGLAFEIPEGYFMMLVPRSSNFKTDLMLTNHCGIADSGYRGEIFFKYSEHFRKFPRADKDVNDSYDIGDRIGQAIILPYPMVIMNEVDQLSETERGTGGYGSTGR